MKSILLSMLMLIPLIASPCGWFYEDDSYLFYNVFDQSQVSDQSYLPFLRDSFHTFYENSREEISEYEGNLSAWQELLPDWGKEELYELFYQTGDNDFDKKWNQIKNHKTQEIKNYLDYSRLCNQLISTKRKYSWDYEAMSKISQEDIKELLSSGYQNWQELSNISLKLRYAYQVIRLLHYSGQYNEAINFYEKQILGQVPKDEIYYYLTDQVAGCYYSTESYEKAAFLFLKVFNHSLDRKKSAFVSYSFCTNHQADGTYLITDKADKATHILMKSLRGFSDEMTGLREMLAIAPKDEKMQLLFIRALNNLEREVWPKNVELSDQLLNRSHSSTKRKASDLLEIIDQMYQVENLTNRDFWVLADSYISFIKNDIIRAENKLNEVTDLRYRDQKEALTHLYKVFSWKEIREENELYLLKHFGGNLGDGAIADSHTFERKWTRLLFDHVGHTYYRKGNLAKAYLTHHNLSSLHLQSSLPLIDSLIAFVKKEGKNGFEEQLIPNTTKFLYGNTAISYLHYVKGKYFLNDSKPELAAPFLELAKSRKDVSGFIFSNNTKECFSCPTNGVMVDSVFLAGVFSFIKPHFDKGELAINLNKLDSLTKTPKQWKRKLAHYLLGNYYYNISSSGYFRQVLTEGSRRYDYDFFNYGYQVSPGEEDNLNNFIKRGTNSDAYHGFAKVAYEHYQTAISLSSDAEFNARCTYLMAKCELNQLYIHQRKDSYDYYSGELAGSQDEYFESFKKLKDDYQNTKFYDKIIKECSFFRYYSSL